MAERERCFEEIEKVACSNTLRGSESLCKLLRYLAKHTLDLPGAPPKEYQIATEVFGRPADFDPRVDSTIRVQMGRLRLKLAQYYRFEGVADPILVDLPKGVHVLSFRERETAAISPEEDARARPAPHNWTIAVLVLSILLVGAIAVIVTLVATRNAIRQPANQPGSAALQTFWKQFVSGPEQPWVIFSNGAFVGRPETGMRYFDPARDSRNLIVDEYTGVGEVLAIHALDGVFNLLHQGIRVKRGNLLSLDDAENNNLIFVGSPAENLTLLEIPGTREFVFQRLSSGPRKGDLAIVNVHPQPGEPQAFATSPPSAPLTEDHSLIAMVRGVNPAQHVMILAGITTLGTQAAVEYVCRPNSVQELLRRLGVSNTGELKPFEAVLRVKVTRGVPVETALVALRKGTP